MKESYKNFCKEIKEINFLEINRGLESEGLETIKMSSFQPENNYRNGKMKDSPWMNKKEPFENRENTYIRIVDIMASFIRFEEKNFLAYASLQNFGLILNKLENFRLHSEQIQVIFYLIKANNRKLINLYVKLRKEIVLRCGLNTDKFKAISIHNPNKNFNSENFQLENLMIDYTFWGMLSEVARTNVEEDMLWWLSEGNRRIKAIQFVKVCLWNHLQRPESPKKN